MKISKRQLKRIIREEYTRLQRQGLLREYGQYGGVDWERVEQYEKTLIKKFAEEKGREPNEEEGKQLSKRAYEEVAGGV